MYLSKLLLDPRSRQVLRELAEPYEMHRTLSKAFDALSVDGKGRLLFRAEPDRRGGAVTVLVQSATVPDWSRLNTERYLVEALPPKEIRLEFLPGQRCRFRLRANPTVKRKGHRHALMREEEQIRWLRGKGERHGFRLAGSGHADLPDLIVTSEGRTHGRKGSDEGEHRMVHFAVRFDGVLEVTDPASLAVAVRDGIGSAKAFGFGLLSLTAASPRTAG